MIKRSVRVRLEDMLETLDGAREVVEGVTFDDYKKSFEKRKALERCVEVIS